MKIRDILDLFESVHLDESFKDARKNFVSQGNDDTVVVDYLNKFKELSKQNKISGSDKDIGKWMKSDWQDFKKFVDKKSTVISKRQKTKSQKRDAITVDKSEDYTIVIPLSEEASIMYGKNTKWCTAASESDESNRFNEYFYQKRITLLYILMTSGKKYAFAGRPANTEKYEIFDYIDDRLSDDELEKNTGITVEYCHSLINKYDDVVKRSRLGNIDKMYPTDDDKIKALGSNPEIIEDFLNAKIQLSEDLLKFMVGKIGLGLTTLLAHNIIPSKELQDIAIKSFPLHVVTLIEEGIDVPDNTIAWAIAEYPSSVLGKLHSIGYNVPDHIIKLSIELSNKIIPYLFINGYDVPRDAVDEQIKNMGIFAVRGLIKSGYVPSSETIIHLISDSPSNMRLLQKVLTPEIIDKASKINPNVRTFYDEELND